MEKAIVDWLENAITACSSYDVVSETKKLYPAVKQPPHVVHIGPVTFVSNVDDALAKKTMALLDIDYPYLIFPGNFFPHKNHLNLFSAFSMLKKKEEYKDFKLILTGLNTDQIPFGIAEKIGVRLVNKIETIDSYDVLGLGYQPNYVIDILIKNARLLISPSLYEAICTPGLDAWNFGTPTAISDIAPFREHESVWGIRSAFFNPMDPQNIAEVIDSYLKNYVRAKEDAVVSKRNISLYTWDKVAEGYLNLFKMAIKKT